MSSKYPILSFDGFESPEQRLNRQQLALSEAKAAADALREEFGVHDVFLFGSLLDASQFGAHSDIDLAVRGMQVDSFYRANAVLMRVIKDFEFDLVDMDICKPAVLKSILETGVKI